MTRRRILIALAVVFAAILFLPLRLVSGMIGFDDLGVTARHASGTIWSGRMEQVRGGGFDLGTLDVGLKPLPLLLGRANLDFQRTEGSGGEPLSGSASIGPGRRAIDGLTGVVVGGDFSGIPVERIAFEQASVVFADGQCREASGRVTVTIGFSVAGLQLRNGMTGALACEGRELRTVLVGQSGLERLILTSDADGNYVARLLVQSTDPVLGAALSSAGFGPTAEGFVRTMRGRF